jgi:hypothetical protein
VLVPRPPDAGKMPIVIVKVEADSKGLSFCFGVVCKVEQWYISSIDVTWRRLKTLKPGKGRRSLGTADMLHD